MYIRSSEKLRSDWTLSPDYGASEYVCSFRVRYTVVSMLRYRTYAVAAPIICLVILSCDYVCMYVVERNLVCDHCQSDSLRCMKVGVTRGTPKFSNAEPPKILNY